MKKKKKTESIKKQRKEGKGKRKKRRKERRKGRRKRGNQRKEEKKKKKDGETNKGSEVMNVKESPTDIRNRHLFIFNSMQILCTHLHDNLGRGHT